MPSADLITLTDAGLYCEPGDFFVDPWQPVDRAIITHGHADHARPGHARYLAAREGERVLRTRLGDDVILDTLDYGQSINFNGVRVSLHPAGHVLGSAQVRMEYRGEVWVISGDYKLEADATCSPFETLRCHVFITESTFGLPIYRWRSQQEVFGAINAWWRNNQSAGKASVLYAYALGKAQRVLAGIDAGIGPIFCHGAVEVLNRAYRDSGVRLPDTHNPANAEKSYDFSQALVVAPPSAQGTPWLKRFGDLSDGFASGWMQIRGTRRRRAMDQGFVLSDHADWPGLVAAIEATGAERIFVTHGFVPPLVRWLRGRGYEAWALDTEFEGEEDGASWERQTEIETHGKR
jgi:putative mRNA 3-end processing factor